MKLIKIEVDRYPQSCSHCDFACTDNDDCMICVFKRECLLEYMDAFDPFEIRASFCPLKVPTVTSLNSTFLRNPLSEPE